MTDLREHWARLIAAAGLAGAAGMPDALLEAYAAPGRHYHDVRHLQSVLSEIDALESRAVTHGSDHGVQAEAVPVRLAGWFHDAIYDAQRGDNEERSALWAEQALGQMGAPDTLLIEVGRLIRLTAGHQVEPGDANGAWLYDADLAVLAGSEEEYASYLAAVRAEYAHVSDGQWRVGRAAVLEGLMASGRLFTLMEEWERPARENLEREFASLR